MAKTLANVGEFGLIHRIQKLVKKEGVKTPGVTINIGDDTASVQPRPGYELLVTCDCLIDGQHFLSDRISPLDLGRRAMVVNISDIGAMGGRPMYALVSLGLKTDMLVEDVENMYRGFLLELNPFEASIIGGNITKTRDAIFIDITLLGEIEKDKLILRSTASKGDAILVTGYPGQAAAGLQILKRSRPRKNTQEHPLVCVYNTPSHRAMEGQAISRSGYATAMIDTSDGFLGDLGHICQDSGVGAELIQDKLPISDDLRQAALDLKLDVYELFLQDSDDYELIITCAPKNIAKIRAAVASVSNLPVTEIGKITDSVGDIQLILPDGTRQHITPEGWDHFAKGGEDV